MSHERHTVDGHSGGHCLCSLDLLEAQERLAAALLRVVEAARAWREAVHDLAQPMVPRQLDLLAAIEAWEAGAS